jgi:hypothetical protein
MSRSLASLAQPHPTAPEAGPASSAVEPPEPAAGDNRFPLHRRPSALGRAARGIVGTLEWLFGCLALFVALAVLATLPGLQLLSLGYLLEVAGRVAREGKISAGVIGIRKAARLGGIVLGTWLLMWPLRFVSLISSSARLIEPGGKADRGWTIALWALTALFALHVASACWRGGRLSSFFWPRPIRFVRQLAEPGAYLRARDAVWDFVVGLRLPYYFWLGLRGFVGGLAWLAVPITLLAAGARAPLLGILGGILLAVVVLYLPFAQVRFAAENRLGAMFELRAVRDHFRRAPVAFLAALVGTLLFAVPLYLLKIEIIPREAAWLPALVFVAFIGPARLLTGWAYARARRRAEPRHWIFRIAARLLMVPSALAYVVIVYFTQFTSWYGIASLYEQHAFLVPVPFLGL